MKKLFTILIVVLATILINSCSEDASPTQEPIDTSFTVIVRYGNPNYYQQWYIHVWVYDDKGVFNEHLISDVPRSGMNGYQYVTAEKGWEIRYGRSLEVMAKESNVVKLYDVKVYAKTDLWIE